MKNFPYGNFNNKKYELHRLVLDRIPAGSRVLDVGCGSGAFAGKLVEKGCEVYGLEYVTEAAKTAKKILKRVEVVDLETMRKVPFEGKFDYITVMEVIEHLKNAKEMVKLLKKSLKPGGRIFISTPNIAYLNIRLHHLNGKFNYTEIGILDKTHVHFYTKQTLMDFIGECGLKVVNYEVTSVLRYIFFVGSWLDKLPQLWQYKLANRFDTWLGYQFVAECKNG